MKINGRKIEGPNIETIVIPRGNGEPIVFKAQAILDYSEFEKQVPEPTPAIKILRGGRRVKDTDSVSYKEAVKKYGELRVAWIVLESLKATEDLEWEKVDYDDPSTWHLFEEELKESGFSTVEIYRIMEGAMDANCLNEQKLNEARTSFLASQQAVIDQSSSPTDELSDTQSGEPANASD